MQVIEWGTPFEGQPNRSDQVKDSFANAIARVKRQIYFVDVILGDPIKYGTPGEKGLATKEQVLGRSTRLPKSGSGWIRWYEARPWPSAQKTGPMRVRQGRALKMRKRSTRK